MPDTARLEQLAKLIRYYIMISTTAAQSGHPTSSLSAVELMTTVYFGGFLHFDLDNPDFPDNDRVIFSKGHASPLLYALYAAAGKVTQEELKTLRQFGSKLEGHPTMDFPYTEAPTGSLGQGLSVGLGMALNAKYLVKSSYQTYVLLGDSEMAEGSVWEAFELASHYDLHNLTAIIDVNRLGQRGETMYGHDLSQYQKKAEAFGWNAVSIDGHSFKDIAAALTEAQSVTDKPSVIIAKTLKGKGFSIWEDQENWHSKQLNKQQLETALKELGEVDLQLTGTIAHPDAQSKTSDQKQVKSAEASPATHTTIPFTQYKPDELVATKKAYGTGLTAVFEKHSSIVALDAEVSNSTHADIFKQAHPDRFFEMFIAEQNMVGTALGLARRGQMPFVSTFAAFLTRAFDQIRMSQYADTNITFVGAYGGTSLGKDGASQMGLEDIAMFRTLLDGVVLYPADAVSTEKMVALAADHKGLTYIRTTREPTPIIYSSATEFSIGGSVTLKQSEHDQVTIIAAGITLHEALQAYDELVQDNIVARVIDLYSLKPIDEATLLKAVQETKAVITVEDHFPEGGIGEAVASALADHQHQAPVYSLAVRNMPRSGTKDDLLDYEQIDSSAIIKTVKKILAK